MASDLPPELHPSRDQAQSAIKDLTHILGLFGPRMGRFVPTQRSSDPMAGTTAIHTVMTRFVSVCSLAVAIGGPL